MKVEEVVLAVINFIAGQNFRDEQQQGKRRSRTCKPALHSTVVQSTNQV